MRPEQLAPDIPARAARTMLFVPATRWAVIEKAAAAPADAVCIDLEDSVPIDEKVASRANVVRALQTLDFGGKTRLVRMNATSTPFAYGDIISVVEGAGAQLDLVMLPKAASADDVVFVDMLLTQIEQRSAVDRRIGIEAQIESASGFVHLHAIASASTRLEALIFGPGDYAASLHMPASSIGVRDAWDAAYPGDRWHAVMHGIAAAARDRGLRCIDGPYAAFSDATGFERSCRIARALGYDGKQCIHPSQLVVAAAVFSSTEEEVAQARHVVEACDRAAAAGRGAATLDGVMIDAASARMARSVLQRSRPTLHSATGSAHGGRVAPMPDGGAPGGGTPQSDGGGR